MIILKKLSKLYGKYSITKDYNLAILTTSLTFITAQSGGEQQRVPLARIILAKPD